jgi:hypothetical protein
LGKSVCLLWWIDGEFVVECGVNVVDKTTRERDEKHATFANFILGVLA